MPIVDVELVVSSDSESAPDQDRIRGLADQLGSVFGSRPTGTWVRVRLLPVGQYAENDQTQPQFPVFVTVIRAELPDEDALADEARSVNAAVASALGRPVESVHVIYEPKAAGRIAFGGTLRRE